MAGADAGGGAEGVRVTGCQRRGHPAARDQDGRAHEHHRHLPLSRQPPGAAGGRPVPTLTLTVGAHAQDDFPGEPSLFYVLYFSLFMFTLFYYYLFIIYFYILTPEEAVSGKHRYIVRIFVSIL